MTSENSIVLAPNTEHGVYEEILAYLANNSPQPSPELLDLPCGNGSFLHAFQKQFPQAKVWGADIELLPPMQARLGDRFQLVDASHPFALKVPGKLDLITCISGVMEFDNTGIFVENCAKHLKPGGTLIISNDNCTSVRDRLSFLLFGRVRRFALFFGAGAPTYKHVPIQELYKILVEHGFELVHVRYLSVRVEDFLLLPLAALLYLFQFWHITRMTAPVPVQTRLALYPFASLLYRHYFLVARKKTS